MDAVNAKAIRSKIPNKAAEAALNENSKHDLKKLVKIKS
jgi:hypothetical protein